MEILYQNAYGAICNVNKSPNPECTLQLVIESVGLFMSRTDLEYFLSIVQKPFEPCHCGQCQGKMDTIWCNNPIMDVCIKFDRPILRGIEELVKGALFVLDMRDTLTQNNLTTKEL
ncbi:MAG: hypothetical protein AAGL34_19305 [Bacteroidota bacterium]